MNTIKSYIRKEDGTPIGVVVAVNNKGFVQFGYALVNSMADQFSKEIGTKIAIGRAKCHIDVPPLPELASRRTLIISSYIELYDRAVRYFKDCDVNRLGIGETVPKNRREVF